MTNKLMGYIKFKIMRALLVLVLLACVIAWLDKMFNLQGKNNTSEAYVASVQQAGEPNISVHKKAFAEEEEKREASLAIQRDEKELAKASNKRQMSNECQFWKLQQKMGKSSVANVKVNQYCTLHTKAVSNNL